MTDTAGPAEPLVTGSPAAARLALWEGGIGRGPLERDLALLDGAFPDAGWESLAGLGIGRRDATLLEMYEVMFGSRLDGVLDCSSCGEVLEMSVDVSRLRAQPAPAQDDWVSIDAGGYEIGYRLPDTVDLMAVAVEPPGTARAELARRVLRASRDGEPIPADALPPQVLAAALDAMAAHDPLAEVELCAACPSCGASCTTLLNVGAFLWARIDVDARLLLGEVDLLARAYGWSEPQILALGERRRRAYLELAQ